MDLFSIFVAFHTGLISFLLENIFLLSKISAHNV